MFYLHPQAPQLGEADTTSLYFHLACEEAEAKSPCPKASPLRRTATRLQAPPFLIPRARGLPMMIPTPTLLKFPLPH